MAERRVARAEVVHRELDTKQLELLQSPSRQVVVGHHDGLGDLEDERPRIDSGLCEHRSHVGDDIGMLFWGLGDCPNVDSIQVRWPNKSLSVDTYTNVPANNFVELREGDATLYKINLLR